MEKPQNHYVGDHGQEDYNEVGIMKTFAIENGVSFFRYFMDHAGFFNT